MLINKNRIGLNCIIIRIITTNKTITNINIISFLKHMTVEATGSSETSVN